ncbi:rRNA pseudouridine synthase, partial [Enterococcus lactis]
MLFAFNQVMVHATVEFRQNRNVESLLHRIEVEVEHLEKNESYYVLK